VVSRVHVVSRGFGPQVVTDQIGFSISKSAG
jgi:hypothetical protein